MTKYIVASAFGLWLGWCVNGAIEQVREKKTALEQRIERLEERLKALERPIPVQPRHDSERST